MGVGYPHPFNQQIWVSIANALNHHALAGRLP
jgi:hypothetical protein